MQRIAIASDGSGVYTHDAAQPPHVAGASAFSPVLQPRVGVASRSDVVMAAKKKGKVNPALFATGIKAKEVPTRGKGRTGTFRDEGPKLKAGAAAGMWVAGKPWLENQKMWNRKSTGSKLQALSGSLGSKEGRGGGAGAFFLGGGRSRKPLGK